MEHPHMPFVDLSTNYRIEDPLRYRHPLGLCKHFLSRLEDPMTVIFLKVSQTYQHPCGPGVAGKPLLWFASSAVLLK